MKVVVILSHGSRSKNSNLLTEKVAESLSRELNIKAVIANLQLSPPYLEEVIEKAYNEGVRCFIVHPFFLHKGVHVEEDIPKEIEKLKETYKDAEFILTDVTGSSSFVHTAVCHIVRSCL